MGRAWDFVAAPISDGDKSAAQSGENSPHSKAPPHSRLPSASRRAFHRGVSKLVDFAKYWLPVCAMMVAIFIASTELGSSHRTSRIIGPLLRWLKPDIADETVAKIQDRKSTRLNSSH